ncbi:MAG: PQQ-binding-like beta-propeller repeat protein [Planctomycetota bacterium]
MLAAMLISICFCTGTDDEPTWPRFRGTGGSGSVSRLEFPDRWDGEKNVVWKATLPGGGWSSPIVADDLVIVTAAIAPQLAQSLSFRDGVAKPESMGRGGEKPTRPVTFLVVGLDLGSGETRWTKMLASEIPAHPIHPSNTYATETAATDGERIFVYFGGIGLVAALDLKGEELWRRDIGAYPMQADFGTGSSLVTDGKRVFVTCDNEEESFLVALDAATGEESWRASRPRGSAWSTPTLWQDGDRTVLVSSGATHVTAHDPATGEVAWKLTGYPGSFTASPAVSEERLYVGASGPMSRGPLLALPRGLEGELDLGEEGEALAWRNDRCGPGMASPVEHRGRLYVIASAGIVDCYDASTGERLFKGRLPEAANVTASLWAAGDRVFILDEAGKTFVLKDGPVLEILHTNEIDDLFWSTPSMAGDRLLLRGAKAVYCIGAKKEAGEGK